MAGLCWVSLCLLGSSLFSMPLVQAAEVSARQAALSKLAQEIVSDHPDIPHIGLGALREKTEQVLLIDVREPKEFAVSRIPGAINISAPEALLQYAQNHDGPLVLYCSVGRRSADLTAYLHAQGITHATNFVGSILPWGNAGLPLLDDQGATELVHPNNWFWGWQYLDDALHATKPR